MEIIKRKIEEIEKNQKKVEYVAFNSRGTLTIVLEGGILLNFNKEDFELIKKFVQRL